MAVLKADPEFRRNAMIAVAGLFVFGLWFNESFLPQFFAYANAQDPQEALALIRGLCIGLSVPLFLCALWLFRHAQRVWKSNSCPPPGAKVLRDTEIIEGPKARKEAIKLVLAGAISTYAGFVFAVQIPGIFTKLAP